MPDMADIQITFATAPAADMTVTRHTLTFSDGYRTSLIEFAGPTGGARLPVLYVHGIQSHPGWFASSAQAMARVGHRVFMLTRRGSGDTTRRRGDGRSIAQLSKDLTEAIDTVCAEAGTEQCHAVGVSWGGKWLTSYCCSRTPRPRICSLVLSAPGIVPRVRVSPILKVAIGVSFFTWPRRTFTIPLNDETLFTDNEAMREYLRADTHRLHKATARFYVASTMMDRRIRRAPAGRLTVPTTLLLASRDQIINSDATAVAIRRLTNNTAHIETFDAVHTLDFEVDPSPSHAAICAALARAEA